MAIFDKKKLQKMKEKELKEKKHTIMIVDDEEDHLTSLENLLSEEYHIFTSRDGLEALDRIKAMEQPKTISVVIADQRMPKLTGLQLFEKIKDIIPNTIRIILTGFVDVPVILDAINKAKIYEFILKDFEPDDLKLRVKRALEAFDLQQQLDEYRQSLEQKVEERTRALNQKNKELEEANKKLIELSLTDHLTGLRNTRYLNEFIDQDISLVQKDYEESTGNGSKTVFPGWDFIFFILEIDDFKRISETYRHPELDRLLKEFSDILQDFFNDSDIIVRRGDAEFLIVNRFTEKDKAQLNAKRLLRKVEEHTFDLGNGEKINLTCSLGSACYPFISNHYDAINWQNVINIAEFALCTAKNSGGNTLVGLFNTDKTKSGNLFQRIMEEIEELLENGEINAQSSLPLEKLVWRKIKIRDPMIRERWNVLDTLDNLIFSSHSREAEIHRIFEENLWILGTDYRRMASNNTLKKTIEERLCKKYKGDSAKKRPDLLLAEEKKDSHLLIEFKRPGHILNRNDESQALYYRDELNTHIPNSRIKIMLIGGGIKKNISPHNLRDDVEYLSYQGVISSARNNLKWLIEDLEKRR